MKYKISMKYSKYRFLPVLLSAGMLMAGCSSKSSGPSADSGNNGPETSTEAKAPAGTSSDPEEVITGYLPENASKYVTTGSYVGLDIEKNVYEVTDEDIQIAIDNELYEHSYTQKLDRAAQDGDLLLCDMTTTINGETETTEDLSIDIGYEEYGEEFDKQAIGCKAGDTLTFTQSFEEDDPFSYWPGETVEFSVKVKEVQETVIPKLTDEWVKENTVFDSIEAYEAGMRAKQQAEYDAQSEAEAIETALAAGMANAEFKGYPEDLYEEGKEALFASAQETAEMYGMSVEEVFDLYEMTTEDMDSAIVDAVNRKLFVAAVMQNEKMEVTSYDVAEKCSDLYADYGFDSADAFRQNYGDQEIAYVIAEEKVASFILDSANITEVVFDYSEEDLMLDDSSYDEEEYFVEGLGDAGEDWDDESESDFGDYIIEFDTESDE